jgi:polyhydroxybutyrate depolymerase
LISGGLARTYWLHIPRGYQPAHPYPLVLVFHGHNSTALHMERATRFSQLADHVGVLVAYPQGAVGPDRITGWASGGPNKPHVDDMLFISNLLDQLQAQLCVDPSRIYATGFSNGGGLTSVLACALAGRIAAFALVAGSYFMPPDGCHPVRPVSILEIHGTGDRIVPYAGRPHIDEQGALQWLEDWATRDGCSPPSTRLAVTTGVSEIMWTGCQGGASVLHYRLTGGVHAWPGASVHSPPADATLDATAIIWQFFATHPLPAAIETAPV